MQISDLEPGDVLLFSAEEGSFLSWAITFLTDMPVSHAAIFYDKAAGILVEESIPRIRTMDAKERFGNRTITVRRLDNREGLSMSPVLDAAGGYLNELEPYGLDNLYLVGLLLMYKRFTPDTWKRKVVIKILKKVTAGIVEFVNRHKHAGKLPMVCSQFVTQCFDDAGPDYRLRFAHKVLLGASHPGGNLLDRILEHGESRTALTTAELLNAPAGHHPETAEELCGELKKAFEAPGEQGEVDLTDELHEAVHRFSQAHYLLRTGESPDPEADRAGAAHPALLLMKEDEKIFITPGDLLRNCTNLETVGTIG